MMIRILAFLAALFVAIPAQAALTADQVALICNPLDAQSVAYCNAYKAKRAPGMVLWTPLPFTNSSIKYEVYAPWAAGVKSALAGHPEIKAVEIGWRFPLRVECDSLTTALTVGIQRTNSCIMGKPIYYQDPTLTAAQMRNPYYGSLAASPPMIATRPDGIGRISSVVFGGRDAASSYDWLLRNVASDGSRPTGTVYISYSTFDTYAAFLGNDYNWSGAPLDWGPIKVSMQKADTITGKTDCMGWFHVGDGMKKPIALFPTNVCKWGPFTNVDSYGGRRDAGGNCEDSGPWLTSWQCAVSEPYLMAAKFPRPAKWIPCILTGNSSGECLWSAVEVPLNGLIIADMLNHPYGAKGNDFPAVRPPNDPCLSPYKKVMKIPTMQPVGTRVVWIVVDGSGATILTGIARVPSSQILAIGFTAVTKATGPLGFNADVPGYTPTQICSVVIP